ncbi:MAG: acetyl-CoA carboxylase biotin carboxyl carrier protein subunit [Bacteroidales bacterium]|nr:acetyl-CoA carboxylase biotin carboxyl carrier protein subunit [Candidatus Liminaster caballi]
MNTYKMKINGNEYEVAVKDVNGQNVEVEVNGKAYQVELAEAPKAEKPKPVIARPAAAAPVAAPSAAPAARPAAGAAGSTKSPLPGTVLSVNVTVGQAVKAADVAVVLEAMKMENNINCGKDGVVKAVYVQKGDNVLEGADLLLIE